MYSDRDTGEMQDLVRDLDAKLGRSGSHKDGRVAPANASHSPPTTLGSRISAFAASVPVWSVYLLLTAVVVAGAWVVLQPNSPTCEYSRDICAVQRLDIDALRITIPESDLIAQLPDINEIDPDDRMTAGEIFAMEQFEDLDLAELLKPEEVERLLEVLE